jgi:hypothetical protein
MAEKDVDEQFAAIMAHWDDVALGLDPSGDPHPDPTADPSAESESGTPVDSSDAGSLEIRRIRDVSDLPDLSDDARLDEDSVDWSDADNGSDPELDDSWDVEQAHGEAEEEEHHYTPPPPAPLPPSEDKHFWLMIIALVAGPLMFLYLLLFNRDGNGWWMMFALLVSIAGFVLLVLRQPLDRDEGDDGIRL